MSYHCRRTIRKERQWQAGRGIREITRPTGLARNTIRKYLLTAVPGTLHVPAPFCYQKRLLGKSSPTMVSMADTEPGGVAEADFGRSGLMWDAQSGRRRQAWGMVIVLGYSTAVVGTDPLNPRLTGRFLEYAQHRGFIADPTRPGHPKDKPKVERQVPYVGECFFKGGQFHGLQDRRQQARRWCLEIAEQICYLLGSRQYLPAGDRTGGQG